MKVIENQTENITVLLQNSAVNPLITYSAQLWPSHLEKDMVRKEKGTERTHRHKSRMASSKKQIEFFRSEKG